MESQCKQNFHEESENKLNEQINLELHASYVYQSMSVYFDRDDVALPGFSKYFKHQSQEERDHAQKFMNYQNLRGGRVVLTDVVKPSKDEWGSGLDAMQSALELEKKVNASLLALHATAGSHGDAQFCDFIEDPFLEEQVDSIKQISNHITNLKRVKGGLGEYLFDHETLEGGE